MGRVDDRRPKGLRLPPRRPRRLVPPPPSLRPRLRFRRRDPAPGRRRLVSLLREGGLGARLVPRREDRRGNRAPGRFGPLLPSGEDGRDPRLPAHSDAALAEATAAGKPVVIDFFADWCLPCKELEKFTFTDAGVRRELAGWVLLKADLTQSASPEVAALRTKWNIQGVPTIVFLGPDGKESKARVVQFEKPAAFLSRFPK
ncbi:MAG: thioredoxin family protein [Holophagales bacterium]|nr:thioredoxin family protein [Holophagales bacterium]